MASAAYQASFVSGISGGVCAASDPRGGPRSEGGITCVQVPGQATTEEWSGAYLMQNGVGLRLVGDYDSTAVLLERE
jgi:hypothetical protein